MGNIFNFLNYISTFSSLFNGAFRSIRIGKLSLDMKSRVYF